MKLPSARRGRAARLTERAARRAQTPRDRVSSPIVCSDNKKGRVLIIACGAIAREIVTIKEANALDHLDLQCLPAELHLYPEQIPSEVRSCVETHRSAYAKIYIAYGDCGTGGALAQTCKALGVEMIEGPHCYAFFEGNAAFNALSDANEIDAFYLTDFLARQFDAFVWRPMGLDQAPELRDTYFAHYSKLVYQSQTHDPALLQKAKDCAARLGLPFEHRHTGFGELQDSLLRWSSLSA